MENLVKSIEVENESENNFKNDFNYWDNFLIDFVIFENKLKIF